jgi:hypothetical protein
MRMLPTMYQEGPLHLLLVDTTPTTMCSTPAMVVLPAATWCPLTSNRSSPTTTTTHHHITSTTASLNTTPMCHTTPSP